MLDPLIGAYSAYRHSEIDAAYDPSQAVTAKTLINPSGEYLTVLFPPWRGGGPVYRALTRRLVKKGSAVLVYRFHKHVLEPDIDRVVDSFGVIKDTVTSDIRSCVSERGYRGTDLISTSLGNVSMCLVAGAYPDFRRATMVAAGSNLARSMWEGNRTEPLRAAFETQGVTKENLDTAWDQLAPMRHAEAFAGKNVAMYVSQTDKVIPYAYQAEMAESVIASGADVTIHSSRRDHAESIVHFCLRGQL